MIPDAPSFSRAAYSETKLRELNNTPKIKDLINRLININEFGFEPETIATFIDPYLRKDGYYVKHEKLTAGYVGSKERYDEDFEVKPIATNSVVITPVRVEVLGLEYLQDQIKKIKDKVGNSDYDGAITNIYTLIETLLKHMLSELDVEYKESEGDIRKLYSLIQKPLNLTPSAENIENNLKTILQGLISQVSGFYHIANTSSDRHHKKYQPKKHHTELVVNAGYTFCNFILDSYNYQKAKESN